MPVVGGVPLSDLVMAASEHARCSEWRPDHPIDPAAALCRHTLDWFWGKYFLQQPLHPKLFEV
jgi:hypothetical protein